MTFFILALIFPRDIFLLMLFTQIDILNNKRSYLRMNNIKTARARFSPIEVCVFILLAGNVTKAILFMFCRYM